MDLIFLFQKTKVLKNCSSPKKLFLLELVEWYFCVYLLRSMIIRVSVSKRREARVLTDFVCI